MSWVNWAYFNGPAPTGKVALTVGPDPNILQITVTLPS
jgi:hypothetical protein